MATSQKDRIRSGLTWLIILPIFKTNYKPRLLCHSSSAACTGAGVRTPLPGKGSYCSRESGKLGDPGVIDHLLTPSVYASVDRCGLVVPDWTRYSLTLEWYDSEVFTPLAAVKSRYECGHRFLGSTQIWLSCRPHYFWFTWYVRTTYQLARAGYDVEGTHCMLKRNGKGGLNKWGDRGYLWGRKCSCLRELWGTTARW